jgi:2-phosphosulfolactate phosphatase
MQKIEVCLTPDLLHLYDISGKIVVVIDIFRATSCMVTAFAHGVDAIIPVATVEECKQLQSQGLLAAAERMGAMVEGFDLDNSPFSYLNNPALKGKTLAMTTSNGTKAITQAISQGAKEVLIGAFLNRSAIVDYLKKSSNAVMLLCAGWKGRVNLEDAFYAGAILTDLLKDFEFDNDDCVLSRSVYHIGQNNPLKFLESASHYHRLETLGNSDDIEFCLRTDVYPVVPSMQKDRLMLL